MHEFEFIPKDNEVTKKIADQLLRAARQRVSAGGYSAEVLAQKMAAEFHKNLVADIAAAAKSQREININEVA